MKHSASAMQVAAIFLLTICLTAGQGQSNSNIVESNRAQMLVPFSQISKDDFVIDVSQGNTEYLDGAISIPYTNFLNGKKLRSNEEISRILRDAGVPCDRPIYIYGKCAPCGGGSAPAEYIYLILKSFGYQVRLLDGSLEQWAASGGHTTVTPSIKPKTNCTPEVKSDVAESGNHTRIASGNGSKTDEGFAGTITPQNANPNGNRSDESSYEFEANLTAPQDPNKIIGQFENAINDTMEVENNDTSDEPPDIHSNEYWKDPRHNPFKIRIPLQSYDREGFYGRYGAILRERALTGQPLNEKEMERLNYDWDLVQENLKKSHPKVSFWEMLRGVFYAKQNKQEDSLKINTPNSILGARG